MALITRTYSFTDGTTAYGSQVESEIANVVNTINSCDAGTTAWTKVKTGQIVLTANQDFSSYKLGNVGTPTVSGDALTYGHTFDMGSTKITGLASGTASTDAINFGQLYTGFQAIVQGNSSTSFSTTSSTFQTTNLTASITPTSSAHRIRISIHGTIGGSGVANAYYSIFRDATDKGGAANTGFGRVSAAGVFPLGIEFVDSPGTTSAITYSIKIRNDDGAMTTTFGITGTQVMVLEEVV